VRNTLYALGWIVTLSAALGQTFAQTFNINTVAGSNWVGDGGPATSALLFQAEGITVDLAGNLYISDAGNHRVRKVSPAGVITTYAGTGMAGFSGDGGPATSAQLNSPYGLALDGVGNLYIADLGNARVRRVALDGTISTVAGGGLLAPGGPNEGSAATSIALSSPRNIAWDGRQSFYISDFTGQRVFEMAPDGALTTVAGTGAGGYSGDGEAASLAQVSYPAGLAVDRSGALYIGDTGNHAIRKVANGQISTFAHADTPAGLAFDNFGTLYIADSGAGEIIVMPANSPAATYPFLVQDVACASDSTLYAVSTTVAIHVSFYSLSTVVAGGGSLAHGDGGPASEALLNHPAGVSTDASGNLYIADRDNNRIRMVAANGTITTIAGSGTAGNTGDGGIATSALLNAPESATLDPFGNLWIADTGNQRVRMVTPSGVILAVPISGLKSPVYAIGDAHGNVFIADAGAGSIVELPASGTATTVVSGLQSPRGLAIDSAGNLYFTEAGAAHVDRLSPEGTLTRIAEGSWNIPRGVAVGSAGDLYIADTALQQILRVDISGNVTPIAGTGSPGFSGDGGAALAAALNFPWDVALDQNGNAYIADLENNRIRELSPLAAAPLLQLVSAVDAATLLPGPIAPGMLVDLVGTGLTPAQSSTVQVSVNLIPAMILSITGAAVLIQAPPQLSGNSAQIEIVSQGTAIAQFSVDLVASAPALFITPSGQALANNADGSLNSITNPAPRGSVVAFYGTGQGVANLPVSATIGGYPAQVLYSGPVAGYPGLWQINVQIPAGYLAPGDLGAVITVGSASTQAGVLIAVN
jgi:trimeric autotransporter adhesin